MEESRDGMELRPEEITKIIREQIKNYENRLETSETGSIILVGDGIALSLIHISEPTRPY